MRSVGMSRPETVLTTLGWVDRSLYPWGGRIARSPRMCLMSKASKRASADHGEWLGSTAAIQRVSSVL